MSAQEILTSTRHLKGERKKREPTILRLMSGRLSDKESTTQLDLSVNTVTWYARNIYEK
jgi:DNA-binding CsgD family transcriptional regulator